MKPIEMDFIGYGYDVFEGGYADSSSLQAKVFDFSDCGKKEVALAKVNGETTAYLMYPDTEIINFHTKNEQYGIERGGSTLNSYGSSFQTSLDVSGSYSFFSGEVSSTFSESESVSRSKKYESNDFVIELGVVDLAISDYPRWYNSNEGNNLIDSKFRMDLSQLDIEQFFKTYGTHWVSKIVFGGCARLTYTSMQYSGVSKQDLKIKADAAYQSLVSVKASNTSAWSDVITEKTDQYCLYYRTIGGDAERIGSEPDKWIESVSYDPAVISFGKPSDISLIPVWEFLPKGDDRRNDFERAYQSMLAAHPHHESIDQVIIYDHTNFSGASQELFIGEIKDLSSLGNWNNNIDSIDIPDGLTVTAWEYPGFNRIKYGPYRGPKKINKVYGQNDWDSMKIEYSENVEPFVEIFAFSDFDYSKKCATITTGEYANLNSFNLQNWQNEVNSIIIPDGLRVTAWSHPNFKENQYGPYDGPARINVKDKDDWDSMKIEKI